MWKVLHTQLSLESPLKNRYYYDNIEQKTLKLIKAELCVI